MKTGLSTADLVLSVCGDQPAIAESMAWLLDVGNLDAARGTEQMLHWIDDHRAEVERAVAA